jgi:flagellar motor switch protein FliN/FliY
VVITTPKITETTLDILDAEYVTPIVMVEVKYTVGLEHSNLFLLKPHDTSIICDLMMGGDGINPNTEIGELQLSAVGEAMNQMMGTAATSMSTFFARRVDISPPNITYLSLQDEINMHEAFANEPLCKISFDLKIEGLIESQMEQILPVRSARQLVENLVAAHEESSAAESAAKPPAEAVAKPAEAPVMAAAGASIPPSAVAAGLPEAHATIPRSPVMDAPYQQPPAPAEPQYQQQPQYQQPQYQQPQHPQGGYPPAGYPQQTAYGFAPQGQPPIDPVSVRQAQFAPISTPLNPEQLSGLDLIMDVPLRVTVELGRTRMPIRDVLDLGKGSVVELDKLVGEPVEMLVNGKLIAKGEVVVIDENFGIRVTDIVSPIERFNTLKIM